MSVFRQLISFLLNWDLYIPLWVRRLLAIVPFIFVLYILNDFFRTSHFIDFYISVQLSQRWIFSLSIVIILMCVNWYLEALKWKSLVTQSLNINTSSAIKAVLYGTSLGLITPNRIGDFSGRSLFLPKAFRSHGASATIFSSLSQNIPTFLFGGISCLLLYVDDKSLSIKSLLFGGGTLGLIGAGLFATVLFRASTAVSIFKFLHIATLKRYFGKLEQRYPISTLLRIATFAHIRYVIFIVQFWIIANIFIELDLLLAFECMAITYLSNTILPTNQIVELGVRLGMPAFILSFYGFASEPVAVSAFMIWLINLAIPSLIGSILSPDINKFAV